MSDSGVLQEMQAKTAQHVLNALSLPPEIESIETESKPDSTGDAGFYVTFTVRSDVRIDDAAVKRLTAFTTDVTLKLLQAHISAFPYVTLQQAA